MAPLDVESHKPTGAVYVFDATSGKWAKKKSMPEPAHHVMAAALNGKIYVFGGFVSPTGAGQAAEGGWQPTNASWVYDPQSDAWTALAPMPTPRGAGSAVALSGKLYVIGGAQSGVDGNPTAPLAPGSPQRVLVTVEQYDPASNQWS